jgi:tRNA nucleotidyltransferase/poly(A) polymerase
MSRFAIPKFDIDHSNLDITARVAAAIIHAFVKNDSRFNGKTYIAGGFVRDYVLGVKSKDIDICVEMENGGIHLANAIAEYLGISTVVTFERFGTAMVPFSQIKNFQIVRDILGKEGFTKILSDSDSIGLNNLDIDIEFVQTRIEVYTEENGRKPDVTFGTIAEDVSRRDFTINSMLINLTNLSIMDIKGGMKDLNDHIIRTPNDPDMILQEDPLRILRAIRFAGRYGWNIDPFLEAAIVRQKSQLSRISRERVLDELGKMIFGKITYTKATHTIHYFTLLQKYDLIPFVLGLEVDDKTSDSYKFIQSNMDRVKIAFELSVVSRSLCFFWYYTFYQNIVSSNDTEFYMRKMRFDLDSIRLVNAIKEYDFGHIAAAKINTFNSPELFNEFKRMMLTFYAMSETELGDLFGSQPVIHIKGNELLAMFPHKKKGPWISELTWAQVKIWDLYASLQNRVPTREEVESHPIWLDVLSKV